MPFTPSHAIVALPFVRTPLVPAAIAIGAMAPDLPLFTRGLVVDYSVTHDLRWLPVTVLLSLALLLVWRIVLRPACRMLAPRFIGARLPQEWDRGPRAVMRETFGTVARAILLVLALALGVVTHVLWDAFTHEGRAGISLIPALDQQWGPLLGYKWLQYGSGIGGLIVLAIAGALWMRGRTSGPVEPAPLRIRLTWWLSLPVTLIVAVVLGLVAYGPLTEEFTVQHLAYRTLPLACGVWGALTLAMILVLRAARGRPSAPSGA
ncbi:DUF4184 family protein [Microbacterium sp. 13-71-7]|uniref:DUF4184 family protein n=1 Tax=Microbacterium sp. 13-71-7 TaxID=1970399 RepID=UPI000BC81A2A|nr:DUF4184 family protein [Microbacterium sp. 13-71-7]OZB81931.1 MAG: cell wall anchor protein [Microbacterium sp. 13-71-7]